MVMKAMHKKALCISGGGNKGAFAGGILEFLINEKNRDYDILAGTSTGCLLASLASVREVKALKKGYTSVTNKNVFNIDPIHKKYGRPDYWNATKRIIQGKKTLGESHNLRRLIEKFFKKQHFEKIREMEKELIVVVSNLTEEKVEYKSSDQYGYDDFLDWMWASCNVPVLMSLFEKNGIQYADGVIYEFLPIQVAIDRGATEIDVIVLEPESFGVVKRTNIKNVIHYFFKAIRMMSRKMLMYDIHGRSYNSYGRDIDMNFYYTPYRLTENLLLFEKDMMLQWWEEGYEHAKNENVVKYRLTKSNVFKKLEN